jgi:hypothetical protein
MAAEIDSGAAHRFVASGASSLPHQAVERLEAGDTLQLLAESLGVIWFDVRGNGRLDSPQP